MIIDDKLKTIWDNATLDQTTKALNEAHKILGNLINYRKPKTTYETQDLEILAASLIAYRNEENILQKDVHVGDVVRLDENLPFMDAIVSKIEDNIIHFTRPFVLFIDAGHATISFEDVTGYADSAKTLILLRRNAK